jgi:predicted molibdopterin-dependent oxidoreductase YjgC
MMKNAFILMRDLEPSVAIVNFDYAKENKIQNNEQVKIVSRTGETTKSVLLSKEIPKEIVLIRTNPIDLASTAIMPVGLKWTAGRMEKAK